MHRALIRRATEITDGKASTATSPYPADPQGGVAGICVAQDVAGDGAGYNIEKLYWDHRAGDQRCGAFVALYDYNGVIGEMDSSAHWKDHDSGFMSAKFKNIGIIQTHTAILDWERDNFKEIDEVVAAPRAKQARVGGQGTGSRGDATRGIAISINIRININYTISINIITILVLVSGDSYSISIRDDMYICHDININSTPRPIRKKSVNI